MGIKGHLSIALSERFIKTLTQEGVIAGRKLLAERLIAEKCKVSLKCVHSALEELLNEGLIAKRHGDGNYVRKIPQCDRKTWLNIKELKVDDFLKKENVDLPLGESRSPSRDQQKLKLQLWGGYHKVGKNTQLIYQKMKSLTSSLGHMLEAKDLLNDQWDPISKELIVKELENNPADGYFVSDPLAEHFKEAYICVHGREPTSVIYISLWSFSSKSHPIIRQDSLDAMTRTVQIFRENHATKIGYIGLDKKLHPSGHDSKAYEWAMQTHGLQAEKALLLKSDSSRHTEEIEMFLEKNNHLNAVIIGDDSLLESTEAALIRKDKIPGENMACIVHSTFGYDSQLDPKWSQLTYNPTKMGEIAVSEMITHLTKNNCRLQSLAVLGVWMPGATHILEAFYHDQL